MTTNQLIAELSKPVHSRFTKNLPIDLDTAIERIKIYSLKYVGKNLNVDWEKVAFELAAI